MRVVLLLHSAYHSRCENDDCSNKVLQPEVLQRNTSKAMQYVSQMLLYSNYPTLTLPYFNFIGEGGLTIAPKTVNIW